MFVAVLSDKPELREKFCKMAGAESSKGELAFYSAEGKRIVLVDPVHYPEKIQPLLYSLSMADYFVLIVDGLSPKVGELIVALNSLKADKGVIVSGTALRACTMFEHDKNGAQKCRDSDKNSECKNFARARYLFMLALFKR